MTWSSQDRGTYRLEHTLRGRLDQRLTVWRASTRPRSGEQPRPGRQAPASGTPGRTGAAAGLPRPGRRHGRQHDQETDRHRDRSLPGVAAAGSDHIVERRRRSTRVTTTATVRPLRSSASATSQRAAGRRAEPPSWRCAGGDGADRLRAPRPGRPARAAGGARTGSGASSVTASSDAPRHPSATAARRDCGHVLSPDSVEVGGDPSEPSDEQPTTATEAHHVMAILTTTAPSLNAPTARAPTSHLTFPDVGGSRDHPWVGAPLRGLTHDGRGSWSGWSSPPGHSMTGRPRHETVEPFGFRDGLRRHLHQAVG